MENIKLGSKGSEVTKLQTALKAKGYDVGTLDGIFGKKTDTALRAYQTSLGVTADGILGNWVAGKLYDGQTGTSVVTNTGKRPQVTITAGHSNVDPGAVNGSYREAFIAVEFRNEVARRVRDAGIDVLTDGVGTDNQDLNTAIKLAKQSKLAIEFHLNASDNKTAKGVEALSLDKDKDICKKLCAVVSKVLDTPVRGSDGGWKSQSSGQHARLGYVSAGGIIMESFFISNEAELKKYFENRVALFDAIAKVIIEHVK